MTLRSMLASRFSHLQPAAAAADDDEDMKDKRDDETEAEYKERKAKEKKDEEEKSAAAASEEEEREKQRKSRRARKGKRAKEQDEDDDEDESSDDEEDGDDEDEEAKAEAGGFAPALAASFRRGARAQRRRCARILSSEPAARNVALACHLAFETELTPKAAIGVLTTSASAPAARPGLVERMASATFAVPPAQPASGRGPSGVAHAWDKVMEPFAERR